MAEMIIFCITLVIVVCIIAYCHLKNIEYKTEEIRRKYPMRLDNVPYTQRDIWKEK